jgi:redox-sensitive bicupin YhaK (pirin superfamily)
MFWSEDLPRLAGRDASRSGVEVVCVAGRLTDGGTVLEPLPAPPDSWAASADNDVAIWTVRLEPGARWTLPRARLAASRRMLYFFAGETVRVGGQALERHAAIELAADEPAELINDGAAKAEFLMLQGRPIGEPVAQVGPFVMNTESEVRQAFEDYRRTRFGGWPWPDAEPVHGPEPARFARHANGRIERRPR